MLSEETLLNIKAIKAAADELEARIDRGEITNIEQLRAAVHNEVEFQKIAIREDV